LRAGYPQAVYAQSRSCGRRITTDLLQRRSGHVLTSDSGQGLPAARCAVSPHFAHYHRRAHNTPLEEQRHAPLRNFSSNPNLHCFMTQFVPPTGEDSLSCVTMQTPLLWRYDPAHLDWHEQQLNIKLVPRGKHRGLSNGTKQISSPCHVMYRLGPSASLDRFFIGHI